MLLFPASVKLDELKPSDRFRGSVVLTGPVAFSSTLLHLSPYLTPPGGVGCRLKSKSFLNASTGSWNDVLPREQWPFHAAARTGGEARALLEVFHVEPQWLKMVELIQENMFENTLRFREEGGLFSVGVGVTNFICTYVFLLIFS